MPHDRAVAHPSVVLVPVFGRPPDVSRVLTVCVANSSSGNVAVDVVRRVALAVVTVLLFVTVPVVGAAATARGVTLAQGVTFGSPSSVDGPRGGFTSVSCVSATWCRAAGSHGTVWAWDGHSWTPGRSFGADPAHQQLSFMSCTSTSFCMAAVSSTGGSALSGIVGFDGEHWTHYSGPGAVASADGGTPDSVGGGLSCYSRTFCMEVVTYYVNSESLDSVYRIWNGSSWSAAHSNGYGLVGLDCFAANQCRGVYRDQILRWDGSFWHTTTISSSPQGLSGIDCHGLGFCAVVGFGGEAYVYRDSSWTPATQLTSEPLMSVSCPAKDYCVALSKAGRSMVYHGPAGGWTSPTSIQPGADLVDVSCATASFCAAVNWTGSILLRHPGGWGPPDDVNLLVGAAGRATAVSCASTRNCVLVDDVGAYTVWNGSSWSAPRRALTAPIGLSDISCPTTTWCLAVTVSGGVITRSGGTWSAVTPLFSGYTTAVSCSSPSRCLAVGAAADDPSGAETAIWDGHTWTMRTFAEHYTSSTDASCAGAVCYAATTTGVWRDDATGWTRTAPKFEALTISCPDAAFCQAVEPRNLAVGRPFRYSGDTWTGGSSRTVPDQAISCVSSTYCVAVGANAVGTWNGTSWNAPQPLFPDNGATMLTGLSCRATLCVASDSSGRVVITT